MGHRSKCKTQNYKLLGANAGEKLGELRFGDDFLDTMTKVQSMREKKLIKMDFLKKKLKTSAHEWKRQATDWRKISAERNLIKGWYPEYTKKQINEKISN